MEDMKAAPREDMEDMKKEKLCALYKLLLVGGG